MVPVQTFEKVMVPVPTFEKVMVPVPTFGKVMVPVPTFKKVMVPVPTFEKLRFRFQLHIYTMKSKFLKKFVSFLHSKLFYKEKDYKYQQIYCKM
jgi:hypothetical protein